MLNDSLLQLLFKNQDNTYRDFISALIPNIEKSSIIGVRLPVLRNIAKNMSHTESQAFLSDLPHKYYEENQLHVVLLSNIADFNTALKYVQNFLPYIDNWSSCDTLNPKAFKKQPQETLPYIYAWLKSKHEYTLRFAISQIMRNHLGDNFDASYHDAVLKIKSDYYYVNMMRAWYFATALSKQYDKTIPILENKELDPWTRNKTIQKAVESRLVPKNIKEYLKGFRDK